MPLVAAQQHGGDLALAHTACTVLPSLVVNATSLAPPALSPGVSGDDGEEQQHEQQHQQHETWNEGSSSTAIVPIDQQLPGATPYDDTELEEKVEKLLEIVFASNSDDISFDEFLETMAAQDTRVHASGREAVRRVLEKMAGVDLNHEGRIQLL